METVMTPRRHPRAVVAHAASPNAPRDTFGTLPVVARVVIAFAAAFLAGSLTSFGQGVHGLSSLANSAGPWFVVAALLVLLSGARRAWLAALAGVAFLELMHVGYTVTSNLRGFPDFLSITNFWVVMGVPAGVLAGLVAVWAIRGGRLRALAAGVTTAILVGEGMRALLQVAASTGVATWIAEIVVGVVVVIVGVTTARDPAGRVIALGTAVVGTAAVLGAYLALGG
jgi:hypothetical protein